MVCIIHTHYSEIVRPDVVGNLRRILAVKHSAHDAIANAPYKTSQILDAFEFHGGFLPFCRAEHRRI
ncbi:hypothetical protein A1356_08685 [Methylomonas koyamae]|uniref:Uncharacterized protein n=1 Tax=Methylomonas koyamae TaxID=702114 RepID=A0AA91DE51_9GAMM|nr:hypothetical protein A1356_08685 [Methylomonas koyamae]